MAGKNDALPSIDQSLFGVTGTCPKMSESKSTDEEDGAKTQNDGTNDENLDSFLVGGRWGDAASQHDVSVAQLRKICSQGIADEGSHRGVAWRVLLEYLPVKDISNSWPKKVDPERALYVSMVEQYLAGTMDPGWELKGSLSKRLDRNAALRHNYNKMGRLDGDSHHSTSGGGTASSDDDEVPPSPAKADSDHQHRKQQTSGTTIRKIYDQLPPQFREQWKRSGINLDKNVTTESSTAQALGINHLRVPDFDKMKDEADQQQNFEVLLEDAKLLEEIRKDVVRTNPDLFFYLEPNNNLGLRRYGALERILFVWAKLNKGVRYVQGMNEIVGTIYYVLANDHNSAWADFAEADSYFLFHALMMDMRDVFVPDLDQHVSGIQGRIDNMQKLLSTHDPEVQEHLQECGIDASFYAIRWLTTLLSREFLLPDTIRLWDSMFSSTHKENFLRYVCGTMVMMVREDLLKGDFSSCLRLLQSYPPANVDDILESSRSLWIYESQIGLACHKGGIGLHQALQTISPPPALIMAFGLKGGVAPNMSDQLSATVQTAKQGLMGRAKRFWGGWSTEDDQQIDQPPPQETSEPEPTTAVTPVQSRIWNRRRAGTAESDAGKSVESDAKSQSSRSSVRNLIWNRGRASTDEDVAVVEDDTEPTPDAVSGTPEKDETSPSRRPIWNRGPTSNTSSPSESPVAPVTT